MKRRPWYEACKAVTLSRYARSATPWAKLSLTVKILDGQCLVHYILKYCHTYNIEAAAIDKILTEIGIPSIKIEKDYSQEDVGQIKTRIEAFAEILGTS